MRAVVETAVDGVILIDATGAILMFNPACEKLFGYKSAEVIGENVKRLMPEPYQSEHDAYLANYHRTHSPKIIGIGRTVQGRRKDGSVFPMDLSVGEAKQEGASIFVGIIRDLTERQRSEMVIRETAARLQAVVETAVDGVILIDATGEVLMFNPACERLFGYRSGEVTGRNVKLLMPDPYQREHDGYLANYHRTHERKIIGIGREVQGRRKDGSVFPMDLSVGEAKQEGASIFVGIIHDLTERKQAEAQLIQAQKMEAVGQLSGGIAHDFNNLLTVIIGNAEALSDELPMQPKLQRFLDMIISAGERGAELTQRLLAFSRRQTLQPVEVNCNRLVSQMQQMLQRTLREDVNIKIELEPGLWSAFADAAQLESAILNLAINAQDAMPDGGNLAITTANVPLDENYQSKNPEVPPGYYVMIAVTDDGEGMPENVLKKVFEPFFTTKEVGKGSGLGLSMVYGFVKQSNGHVSIYSDPGLGTTVRIYLPSNITPADMETARRRRDDNNVRGGRETILIAEDDAFVRSYAVNCLESLGYNVISAEDGREALGHLQANEAIDVLFTDIVMPGGMTGLELAESAKALRPRLKVLLTSGYALDTLTSRGRLHVGTAVLHKPYRKAGLAQHLRRIIEEPA
ncbi:PAS domain-containing sensor histidine kinase [Parvibaculum sp.]|uniref:hybrid sensor histidine kinase/response regulator n=1 Tax=Parvibaculum sp. TaxID=2024848 RepID=UPI0025CFF534|nr:PAS domain-containing hybrid sensor histidine kinase/response regulator [Parvibaculum sp.]